MSKRASVLMVFLGVVVLCGAGCRIPLIDPPIIGTWNVTTLNGQPMAGGTSMVWVFDRDKTGNMKATNTSGEVIEESFTWSYKTVENVLTIVPKDSASEDMNVEYSELFGTTATLRDSDNNVVVMKLQSSPVFRF